MNTGKSMSVKRSVAVVSAVLAFGWAVGAQAHCDTLDGPVVGAARKALDANNVNLVLVWVQKNDEAAIKDQFQKTVAVRKAGGQAKELADMYFFETLVRIHRAGEGASYDGIKPTGTVLDPKVVAADEAMETGDLKPLLALIPADKHAELQRRFAKAGALKQFDVNDLAAGRAYIAAYVSFYKFAEGEEDHHHHHH